jgi:hypothetical membrane protein
VLRVDKNVLSWGGLVGPVLFVAAWLIGGALEPGYSPADDAISRLAAVGASMRPLLTAGLAAFALGMVAFASPVRARLAGPAWIAVLAAGVASLGVLATPLGTSATVDDLHGVFAVAGYVSLAAVPLLAASPLATAGRRRAAALSVVVAAAAGLCLAATALGTFPGLLQRTGLTLLDGWIAVAAVWMVRHDA